MLPTQPLAFGIDSKANKLFIYHPALASHHLKMCKRVNREWRCDSCNHLMKQKYELEICDIAKEKGRPGACGRVDKLDDVKRGELCNVCSGTPVTPEKKLAPIPKACANP